MPWPDKDYGIKDNPLIFSPYIAGTDEGSMTPTSDDFLLLDGDQFKLLDGDQFDLLGS